MVGGGGSPKSDFISKRILTKNLIREGKVKKGINNMTSYMDCPFQWMRIDFLQIEIETIELHLNTKRNS